MKKTVISTYLILMALILSACGGSGNAPTVAKSNNAPSAVSDSYKVDSNSTLPVLLNDSDPDGDSISISAVSQPPHGSVSINGDQIDLVIDQNFVGIDSFTYTISDSNGASSTAQVTLELNPANKTPKAVNDRVTGTANVIQIIDVLINDFDSNGDTLTITSTSAAANGTVSILPDQTLRYIPNNGFLGQDDFTYTISDGVFEATANVTVYLTAAPSGSNLPPVANPNSAAVLLGTPTNIDVLINDFDPENDPLSITILIGPDHGTLVIKTISRNGINVPAVEYTPDANYTGPDSFIYVISDGSQSVASTVLIDVRSEASNFPPLARDDIMDVATNATVNILPFSNDSDPENDVLSVVSIEPALHGTYTIDDNGTPDNIKDDVITYTPAPGFTGTDVIVYTLSDGISQDRGAINVYINDSPISRVSVTGSVHKGAVRNSLIAIHPFTREGIGLLGDVVVAATSELDGSWNAEIPVTLNSYMATATGGSFIDESDPDTNITTKRVVELSNDPILQSMWQSGQSHISINAYTSAVIRKARFESSNSFPATIKNNRIFSNQAMGFDPFTVRPTEPISPDSGAGPDAINYALYLGGFANVLNAHSIDQKLPLPTAELIEGSIQDLADCKIDGLTFDGPINVLTPSGNKVFTDITDLNPEIRRFRNNNFNLYPGMEPVFNRVACLQSGVSSDVTAPVIGLNPTGNGELADVFLNVGDPYVEPGVSATDNIDGDLSAMASLSISDGTNTLTAIDTNISGVYVVTYTVIDDSGNSSSVVRTVTVSTPLVSVAGASIIEGDAGTTNLVFVVSLDNVTNVDVTVTATSIDGTATQADSDFIATTQLVTIPAGQLQANFTVLIVGDTVVENNETFIARLSAPTNALLDGLNFESNGEIINDDSTSLTIAGASILEGNSGTTNLPFMITLSEVSAQDVSVDFATLDGTATVADNDYVPLAGSVTTIVIPAGSTTLLINIPVKGDTKTEPDETFSVVLSNAINASLGNTVVSGTILNDDIPIISINDRSLAEGDSASVAFDFSVMLDQSSSQTITVDLAVADQTATVTDNDYQAVAPVTLTFLPGETLKTFAVNVNGDLAVENDETFLVNLSSPNNATLDPALNQGVGTILNDDGVTISISDVVLLEGDSGTSNALFDVNLSNPETINTVSVDFVTLDGSAEAGSDYVTQSGTLSFAPGITSASITVPVNGDLIVEDLENFFVQLTNPLNATISDDTGMASITNDDQSIVTVNSPSISEGDSGQSNILFTLTLDQVSPQTISIDYSTSDGSALSANGDYIATAGSLDIAPGLTTGQIGIPVVGDTTVENDETFTLNLLSAANANLSVSSTVANILNDDFSEISISDASVVEGTAGATTLQFTLGLDQLSTVDIQVDVSTLDGSAIAGSDFTAISQTVTIPANSLSTTVGVTINPDALVEDDETFTVSLGNPVNTTINPAAGTAIGTIIDDDVPVVSINNASVLEGAAINDLVFTVSLDQSSNQDVSFTLATSDVTATLVNNDYVEIPASVFTIPAGSTTLLVAVNVIDDVLVELDETLNLTLSAPVNATLDPVATNGVGQIVNDDGVTISIVDQTITEGNSGTQIMTFNVTLSNPNNINTVTVDYITVDNSALAGEDYISNSGSLSFAPGETAKTIDININGDVIVESDEQFFVQLSNPTNSAISDGQGIGTISNDDSSSMSVTDVTLAEDAGPAVLTVTLSNALDSLVTIDYTTVDGSATLADSDYTLTAGTLSFAPGVTSQTITIPVTADTSVESDESFTVDFSNASTALTAIDSQALISISNDDFTATLTLLINTVQDNGLTDPDSAWTLTASGPTPISGIEGNVTITNATVNSGEYALTTTGPVGYTETGLACSSGLIGSNVTINPGDNITCTFTVDDDVPTYTMSFVAGAVIDDDLNGMDSPGDTITYDYTVTNTGTVPLDNVLIDSVLFTPSTICDLASIPVGNFATCSDIYTITQADIDASPAQVVNDSSVSATDLAGNPVAADSVSAPVITSLTKAPAIVVVNDPVNDYLLWNDADMSGGVNIGDTVRLTFRATNTGNTRLNNVLINNSIEGVPFNCGTLEIAQTCEHIYDYLLVSGGTLISDTDASGQDNDLTGVTSLAPQVSVVISSITIGDADGDGVADEIEILVGSDENNINTKVFYVDPNATGLNNGTSWGNAFTNLPAIAFVGEGATALDPAFLLIKGGHVFNLSGSDFTFNGTCDHISIVGSLNDVFPAKIEIDEQGGASTGFNLSGVATTPQINGCTNFNLIGTSFYDMPLLGDSNAGAFDIIDSTVGIYQSSFLNNIAPDTGGAIALSTTGSLTSLTIGDSLFKDNLVRANTGGGAIYAGANTSLIINDSRFIDNIAAEISGPNSRGGAILVDNASATIDNSTLSGNISTSGGGAIATINNANLSLINSIISGNSSDTRGGGVRIADTNTSNVNIFNNLFTGNGANRAGAIYLVNSVNTVIHNNTFVFNQADIGTGSVLFANNSDVNIFNNIYKDNLTLSDGGYLESYDFTTSSIITCDYNWSYVNQNVAQCPFAVSSYSVGSFYASPHVTTGYYLAKRADIGARNGGIGDSAVIYSPALYPAGAYAEINKTDKGVVDLGYHYANRAPPIPNQVSADTATLIENSGFYTSVIYTPTASGQSIGPGQAVYAELPSGINANLAMSSIAGEQFNRNRIALIDLGNGEYELRLFTGAAESFNVIIEANGFVTSIPITVN